MALELKIFLTCILMVIVSALIEEKVDTAIQTALFVVGLFGITICSINWIWF